MTIICPICKSADNLMIEVVFAVLGYAPLHNGSFNLVRAGEDALKDLNALNLINNLAGPIEVQCQNCQGRFTAGDMTWDMNNQVAQVTELTPVEGWDPRPCADINGQLGCKGCEGLPGWCESKEE